MPDSAPAVVVEPNYGSYVRNAGTALLILGHELAEDTRARRNLNTTARALVAAWITIMPRRVGQGPGSLETARAQLLEAERVLPAQMERATPAQRDAIRARTRALRERLEREIRRVEALPAGARLREQVLDVLLRARVHLTDALDAIGRAGERIAAGALAGATLGVGAFAVALGLLWLMFKK